MPTFGVSDHIKLLCLQVADFGLSRLKQQTSKSHTSTRLTGTWTHIPPEHLNDMHLVPTTKFDVYDNVIMNIRLAKIGLHKRGLRTKLVCS